MEMGSVAKHAFQLVAGHVALDFANTLDWRFDRARRVDLLPNYESLLGFERQSGLISPGREQSLLNRTRPREAKRVLRRALDLRETIDRVFRSIAAGRSPSLHDLNNWKQFLAWPKPPEVVVRRGSGFLLVSGELSGKADGVLWPIVDEATKLLTSTDRLHIKECKDVTCRWLFLDSSKNQSRHWCSMQLCGNRAKVQRFRTRHRGESAARLSREKQIDPR